MSTQGMVQVDFDEENRRYAARLHFIGVSALPLSTDRPACDAALLGYVALWAGPTRKK